MKAKMGKRVGSAVWLAAIVTLAGIGGCDLGTGGGGGSDKVATPTVSPGWRGFIDSATLQLAVGAPAGAVIRYTLDGTDPGEGSSLYSEPIVVTAGTAEEVRFTLKARAWADGCDPSDLLSRPYLVKKRPTTGELLVCGDFVDGEYFWDCRVNAPNGGQGSVAVEGGLLRASPTAADDQGWVVGARYLGGFTLEESRCYELRFKAWADQPRRLELMVEENNRDVDGDGDSYSPYLYREIQLTTTAQREYVFHFTMDSATDDFARLGFNFARDTGTVYVDDVSLQEYEPQLIADYATRIPDANLRAAIEQACGKSFGVITNLDLEGITEINWNGSVDGGPIADLTGVELCTSLKALIVSDNSITDLGPLSGHPTIRKLIVEGNRIQSLAPIEQLAGLTALEVNTNPLDSADLASITPARFPNLVTIGLGGVDKDDVPCAVSWPQALALLEPFGALDALKLWGFPDMGDEGFLDLYDAVLEESASGLLHLQVCACGIGDPSLGLVAGFSGLQSLALWGNGITDITTLEDLTGLQALWLQGNGIVDLAPLETLYDRGGLRDAGAGIDVTMNGLDLGSGTPNRAVVDYLESHGVSVQYDPQE